MARPQVSFCLNASRFSQSLAEYPFGCADAQAPASFFASLGQPATPLHAWKNMAARLGLAGLYIKDESSFLSLPSFKGRGALWALARLCAEKAKIPAASLASLRQALPRGSLHFVTATDGNHGAAVAFGAELLAQKATIFMPAGAARARIGAIRERGAECIVTDCGYDATVRIAAAFAASKGAILIQDTAWPGYERIPALIMQGYATIAVEIVNQLGGELPTHVFLQAGVGSFAAAVIYALAIEAKAMGLQAPAFIIMEPASAACVYESFLANDSRPHAAKGDLKTIMAGLACGEVSSLAWPVLRSQALAAASCADTLARLGMRLLANPIGNDAKVISGESGAIGMGLARELMLANPEWRARLGLDVSARILLVCTEGATDRAGWEAATGEKLP